MSDASRGKTTDAGSLFIGLMSGTSADGIDAVLVDINASGKPTLLASRSIEFSADTRAQIEHIVRTGDVSLTQAAQLDLKLGHQFADAAREVSTGVARRDVIAIGSHGQTVLHHPDAGFTIQIANGAVIAEQTGIPTVCDLRMADMAAGGEGAPLAPAFHAAMFRHPNEDRAVVNIGGISNITTLPKDPADIVLGYDTGPGNTLLDYWIHKTRGTTLDTGGTWAASGKVNAELLDDLLADNYFTRSAPKSTGREYFNADWLNTRLAAYSDVRAEDVQATLTRFTAQTIAQEILKQLPRVASVYVCGGGAHNQTLMCELESCFDGVHVDNTAALGVSPDDVEAIAFAWLAWCTLNGAAGNLPSVTGAQAPRVLGCIWPAGRKLTIA